MSAAPVVWKHIGLHGHSVGTLSCEADRIVWTSALAGGRKGGGDDDDMTGSTTRTIPKAQLSGALWTVFGRTGYVRLQTKGGGHLKTELRLDGFPVDDFDKLQRTLSEKYGVQLQVHNMSAAGTQYGITSVNKNNKSLVFRHALLEEAEEEGQEFEPRAKDEMMSLDLQEVTQCVLPGNNRNELEIQFPESDAVEAGTDQLVSIRFYIPPDLDADPTDKDKEAATAAELLQKKIINTANIRTGTTGDVIVSFDHAKGTFLTPRGRYAMELHDYFLRLRGQKYDYRIKYDDISRLFLLPKPDEVHMAFVIALDKPIRQGQQRYQYLVLQATKEPDEVTVNLDEETLEKEYGGELQPIMRGALSNLIAKTFKVIAKKKVFIPGKFANANQQACVKCAVRANEGLLYPLEKQFVFIHKPPILIRFNEIESVEFQRYGGGQATTRNFDLCVNLKTSVTGGSSKEYVFSGIDRSDYAGLYNFLNGKKIPIKNLQGSGFLDDAPKQAPVYNEDEIYGGAASGDEDEGSDDGEYDEADAAKDEQEGAEDSEVSGDEDDLGSGFESESDMEEAAPAKKKKKKAASSDEESDDDSEEETPKSKKRKKTPKKKKDPKAPKKAQNAYMLYANSVRAQVKEDNPEASFGEVTKLVAAQFKKLSPDERAEWDSKASKDKDRYAAEMEDYSAPEDSDDSDGGGGGQQKKKKPKKDPNAPKRGMTAFFCYSKENRDKIKEENPDIAFGDVGKKLGIGWKALSADEKKKYEDMAKTDKERYEREMKDYSPPAGSSPGKGSAKKGKKAKKDPNAPKRATTSYLLFSNEMRPKLKEQNPDMAFGELGKKLGEMFRALSPEEKGKYEEKAKEDKIRYKQEMAKYKAKQASQDSSDDDDSDDSEEAKPPAKKAQAAASSDDSSEEDDDADSDDSD